MKEIHPLLQNVERYNNECNATATFSEELAELNIELSRRVIAHFIEFNNPHYFMRAPCDRFVKPLTDDLVAVCAMSRFLNASYSLEMSQDEIAIRGIEEAKKYIIDVLAGEIIAELEIAIKKIEGTICPYMPVISVTTADPEFFQPLIGFKTRFGVI